MADGRSSLASDFKAGKGGQLGEENQGDRSGDSKLLIRNGIMRDESAGLEDGVSLRQDFGVAEVEPMYDYTADPLTGNATERKKPCSEISVTSKGHTFEIDNEL
jgi:hypothetical protein